MYSGMDGLTDGLGILTSLDIDTLKQKVEEQEKEIADLKRRLKALEAIVLDQKNTENSKE